MSNPKTISLTLGAAVANGIVTVTAHGSPGAYTLNGSLVTSGVANLVVPRRVLIASSGADSAIVFTITGTDRNGNVQSETLTGVASAASQFSAKDYLTVTGISSAATAGNITIGTNDVGSSEWVADDYLARYWALTVRIFGAAGTTYTLETTLDDPNKPGGNLLILPQQFSLNPGGYSPAQAFPNGVITGATGTNETTFADNPIFAHRLTINSGTGLVVMQSIQACVGSGF